MKRALFPVIIARPMRLGGEGAGAWRRRMSTLGHLPRDTFILLLIIARLTTAACADDLPATPRTPTPQPPLHEDSVDNPDMTSMDLAVLSSVMQASLSFLQPRTLESHTIHDFALWGLNGLSALDPSLSIEDAEWLPATRRHSKNRARPARAST